MNPAVVAVFQVTVTPENDAPTASVLDAAIAEDAVIGQSVVQIDTADVDGDTLTFDITAGNADGRFSITAAGQVQVAALLDHESVPSYALEITVSDAEFSVTANTTVTVTDIDEDPTAADDASSTVEDLPVTFDVAAGGSDPENQTLTWTPQATSAQGGTVHQLRVGFHLRTAGQLSLAPIPSPTPWPILPGISRRQRR